MKTYNVPSNKRNRNRYKYREETTKFRTINEVHNIHIYIRVFYCVN